MEARISESWTALQLGDAIINTIVMSLGSLVFRIVVCGFGGYVLSKLKPTGSKLLFALIVWTMMMPGQIRMVPNYISWLHFPFASDNGMGVNLLDTYWPMWLGAGADTFAVLLFKNAFDALSNSYVEAAKIDGCSNYGVFFKIMLPLATPVLIYESIGVLSAAWSDFFTPLLVLDKNKVVWQTGELGKVDMGGGGTVAMYIANLDVDVIDVGVPVLSMHAPYEVTSKLDVYMAYRAFLVFMED